MTLARRLAAECLGTALLLAMVVGSAVMADRLGGGNAALSLLANSIASATGLLALILAFGAISGAHFNPVVTLSEALQGRMNWCEAASFMSAQVLGAFAGVAAAHLMFGEPAFSAAHQGRSGPPLWLGEFMATFGLIGVIIGCSRNRPALTPFAVSAYIVSGYWFTSSHSFANPALTIARTATCTIAGISPPDAPGYIVAQMLGTIAATRIVTWLHSPATCEKEARASFSHDN